jgi:hypothetical protein
MEEMNKVARKRNLFIFARETKVGGGQGNNFTEI